MNMRIYINTAHNNKELTQLGYSAIVVVSILYAFSYHVIKE